MISVRKFEDADAVFLAKFNEGTTEDLFNHWGGGRYYTLPLTAEQIINRIQNTENTRYFAVERDNIMIGSVELDFIDWNLKECSVCRFYIAEQYRNKGYGVLALKQLSEIAFSQLDMKKIKLSVFDFNTGAYKCYIKAGFEVTGEVIRPNGWKAIQMELTKKDYS